MSRTVILDVDPGADDAVAIAAALGHGGVEVAGLTTVAGNTTVENATRNALSILEFADRTDVPVARGCERPLEGDLTTAEWIHGPDGLRGDLPEPTTDTVDAHAAEFIVERARELGDELTICAVGPLTNLAVVLALEPSLPDLVEDIVVMGGAAMTTGNVTPMAEANFHNDPEAASRVLQDAAPSVVGLDVTNQALVPTAEIADPGRGDDRYGVIEDWLDYPPEVLPESGGGPAVHDAAVVADLVDDVLAFEEFYVEVDTTEGPSRGALVCDEFGVLENEPNARVATEIDVECFRSSCVESIDALLE